MTFEEWKEKVDEEINLIDGMSLASKNIQDIDLEIAYNNNESPEETAEKYVHDDFEGEDGDIY